MSRKTKYLALGLSLVLLNAEAQATTFTAGGTCVINGAWTQMALNQTEQIRVLAQQFKDDKNCTGITAVADDMKAAGQFLSMGSDSANTDDTQKAVSDQFETNPGRVGALQSALTHDPKNQMATKLLGHTFLETVTGGAAAGAVSPAVWHQLAKRANLATRMGLDFMDQAMTKIPSLDQCLLGRPDTGVAFLGAAIKLSAAFVSSGEGISSKLGNSVLNVVNMLREEKFARIMRSMDDLNFQQAVSCLIETTSGAYCSVVDGRELFEINKTYQKKASEIEASVKQMNNDQTVEMNGDVVEGYYIMVRELPLITDWLDRVIFGFHPMLKKDAELKNGVLESQKQLIATINNIEATYRENLRTLEKTPDLRAKKNQAFKMLTDLVNAIAPELSSNMGAPAPDGTQNFFTTSVLADFVPFYLIGMDEIPPAVRVQEDGKMPQSWDTWIKNGGDYRSQFDNPEALTQRMWTRLQSLTEKAKQAGSAYFADRLVVDMQDLVTKALVSPTITVYESLGHIYDYLESLKGRIKASGGDQRIIPHIVDTQSKIAHVILSFNELSKLSKRDEHSLHPAEIQAASEKVIQTVYDKFNILQQRDTFLSTEMATFISYDYSMKVHAGDQFNDYQQKLLITSGRELWDRIVQANSINPADALQDLNNALYIDKRNLEGVESLMGDALVPMIAKLRLIVDRTRKQEAAAENGGKDVPSVNGKDIKHAEWNRWWRDRFACVSNGRTKPCDGPMNADLYPNIGVTNPMKAFSDFWYSAREARAIEAGDAVYNSTEQVLARLCVQTLSFENRDRYQPYCKGLVLQKPDADSVEDDSRLPRSVSYDKLFALKGPKNRLSQICAIRDYSRNNYVYWLVKDFRGRKSAASSPKSKRKYILLEDEQRTQTE